MKIIKSITLVTIISFLLLSCGPLTTTVPSTTISKTLKIEDQSKDVLYIKANNWMVGAFNNNVESIIMFNDKEAGKVSGKYVLKYFPNNGFTITTAINIKVKDGASKISFTPMEYAYGNMSSEPYTPEERNKDINALIASCKDALNKVDDNW